VPSKPLRHPEFAESQSPPAHDGSLDVPAVLLDEPGCLMASWRNITIVVWGTRATRARVDRLARIGLDQLRSYPNGGSTIHLVIDGAGLPDAEGRAALEALAAQFEDKLACVLTVLSGSGFWASAMRGLVTSLHWLRTTKYQARISASHRDVASWFCEHHTQRTKVYVGTSEYNRVLDTMLATMQRAPAAHPP
jgi:hypothetical protein